jgi:hypothetical protein
MNLNVFVPFFSEAFEFDGDSLLLPIYFVYLYHGCFKPFSHLVFNVKSLVEFELHAWTPLFMDTIAADGNPLIEFLGKASIGYEYLSILYLLDSGVTPLLDCVKAVNSFPDHVFPVNHFNCNF